LIQPRANSDSLLSHYSVVGSWRLRSQQKDARMLQKSGLLSRVTLNEHAEYDRADRKLLPCEAWMSSKCDEVRVIEREREVGRARQRMTKILAACLPCLPRALPAMFCGTSPATIDTFFLLAYNSISSSDQTLDCLIVVIDKNISLAPETHTQWRVRTCSVDTRLQSS